LKNLDDLPKSITKAIRYIKQDATQEQLVEIKELVDRAVTLRIKKKFDKAIHE
jgi:hypothetical protein